MALRRPPARRGRPSTPVLSRDRIYREALRLLDREGPDRFTVERLATRLGVRAASLYNHVPSKSLIIEGVRDLIVADMDYSMFDSQPWDVALEQFARSYRAAFARHPNTVALLSTTQVQAPGTFRMYERVATALVDGGWPDHRVTPVIASIEYLILGSVLDLVALGVMFGAAPANDAPVLARCMQAKTDQVAAADDAFDMGIAGLLAGLRAELERTGRPVRRRR